MLPAYNEVESLGDTVAEWSAALATHTADHEIIVVDDGSTDGTPDLLRRLGARHDRLRIITQPRNLGYGAAIVTGFEQARFPLLFFTDADGQYEPEDIRLLLERVDAADIVVGYRLARADAQARSVLSRGYNLLARTLLGVSLRDLNCAFKLMHRDGFRRLGLESRGFGVNAEMASSAGRAGLTLVEVGVRHRPRRAGRSTVRLVHVVSGLYGLARIRSRRRAVPAAHRAALGETRLGPEKSALPRRSAT